MSTDTIPTNLIPPDVLADGEAIVAAMLAGKKPAAELAQRARDRVRKITADIEARHGVLDIGAAAIRELRDA